MLKFLIAAICLVQIAQSYLVGEPECAKGPTYWCDSIQNSVKCNAFKHCLETVWTKQSQYLNAESVVVSNEPNPCTNCVQCVSSKFLYCPYVHFFKDEVDQLLKNNIPTESVCKLMKQCTNDVNTQIENNSPELEHIENNTPVDQNGVEYKIDTRCKCGIHPRNWCDSLETAKLCNAVDKCIARWSISDTKFVVKSENNLSEIDSNDQRTCGFCIFIFTKLQDIIQQNETEVDIEKYLDQACRVLPTKDEVDKCIVYVNKYLPEIYNMVRNNMDPGIICRVLKQCSDSQLEPVQIKKQDKKQLSPIEFIKQIKVKVLNEDKAVIKTPLQKPNNKDTLVTELKKSMGIGCELCTVVMNGAKILIENKQDDEAVLDFIDKNLCSRFGSMQQTCSAYVKEEGIELLKLIANSIDPSIICRDMGLCLKVQVTDDFLNEKFYDLKVRNPMNCTLCKIVFLQVKRMLTEQQSQAKILDYINVNLCSKIGNSKELCKTLIDQYGPLFMELIARDVNPSQLCTMIGMCGKEIEEIKTPTVMADSNPTCVLCEFLISQLTKYINKNATEVEVEHLLDYVCSDVMPVTVRKECKAFVATYGPLIVNLIINEIAPEQICRDLNVCVKATLYGHQDEQTIRTDNRQVQLNNHHEIRCTVCQYTIQYLEHQYNIDKTEKAIEFAVSNVCKLSPKSYRSHCDSMVDDHGVGLINFMERYTDPLKVCNTIRFCREEETNSIDEKEIDDNKIGLVDLVPAKLSDNKVTVNVKNTTLECSLCIYVAEIIDSKLKENKTETQIVEELKLVCNFFPSNLKEQCNSFLNEYGPYVLQLIANDLEPEQACAALKLCDQSFSKDTLRRALLNRF